jgi:hypothetical protein
MAGTMSSGHMTVALEERWAEVEQAARQLFPEIRANDGVSVGGVESAERRLGAALPPLLRALYLRCGRAKILLRSYEEASPSPTVCARVSDCPLVGS